MISGFGAMHSGCGSQLEDEVTLVFTRCTRSLRKGAGGGNRSFHSLYNLA